MQNLGLHCSHSFFDYEQQKYSLTNSFFGKFLLIRKKKKQIKPLAHLFKAVFENTKKNLFIWL